MGRRVGAKDRVSRKFSHCFARQYLQDHGVKIYRGDKQILTPVPHLYNIKLPSTRYFVGDQFVEFKGTRKIYSYEILRNMGFVICSRKITPDERWEKNQVVMYYLARISDMPDNPLSGMPNSSKYPLHAEHDPFNKQLRLIGPRAGPMHFGPWMAIDESDKATEGHGGRKLSYVGYIKHSHEIIEEQMKEWMDIDEEPEPIYIPEAPFLITDANEIVCFPVKHGDMPAILITGQRGTGKSYFMHSIISKFFWKREFDFKIAVLNDSSRETGTWVFPNEDEDQNYILKRLNERALPLPMVYLHPKVKDDYEKLYMDSVGFDITIPFKEIVKNHKEYLKIEGSARYFSKLANKLLNCDTQAQAEALLDSELKEFGIPTNTANKIRAEFETLFDTKMTDISSKKQKPWRVSTAGNNRYNPVTACLHAGVIPVLETEYVSNYPALLQIYFTYFVKDLFMRQKQDPIFSSTKSKLMLCIDECFTTDTLIATDAGPKSIGGLYKRWTEGKPMPMVKSFNFKTHKFEYKTIAAAMRKEQKDLLKINLGVSNIKCTPRHKIHTSNGWVMAKDLKEGDLVSSYYGEHIKNGMRDYEGDQFQLILGGFLGDGFLDVLPSGNYRMRFVQGHKQLGYLKWKRELLSGSNIKKMMSGYTGKDNIFSFQTHSFNFPHKFTDHKTVPDWLLDKIDGRGIAVWFMDDGSLCGRANSQRVYLHTNSYDYETQKLFVRMFNEKYGIICTIHKSKQYFYLSFNVENTKRLLDLVGQFMHEDLHYKLGRKLPAHKYKWSKDVSQKGWMKVKKISKFINKVTWRQKKPYVYDLTVEENHNYIVCNQKTLNGVLVSNCHNISQRGKRSGADDLLRRCVREGRPRRIGTILATQKFTELPPIIRDNTTYLVCFKNPGEANEIANQYKMGKALAHMITDLNKHECVAYTSDYFIVYDSYGRRRKSKPNEIFKGRSLPPYSMHKRPNA